jgi:Trypsin-like peptidase domain
MKRFTALSSLFVLVTGLVSCGGVLSTTPKPLTTQQMVSHEGYATVALVTTDDDNDDDDVSDVRPTCSAVWVDDTHILTAYHCVRGEQKRLQEKQDKKEENRPGCEGLAAIFGLCDPDAPAEHKVIEAKGMPMHYIIWKEVDDVMKEPTGQHLAHVVGFDEAHDLALLEAAGHAVPKHEVAKVAASIPGMGERIHVCGHVKGMYWTFLEGSVAGYRGDIPGLGGKPKPGEVKRVGPYLQLEVPIYYGNSGGGAFDDNGELIGIADFMMRMPSEGFFIPVDPIRAFLVDQEVLPGKVKEEPKKEEVKPLQVVNVTVVAPPAVIIPPADATPPEKANVIPAPPLPIPLPKLNGGLGNVPTP